MAGEERRDWMPGQNYDTWKTDVGPIGDADGTYAWYVCPHGKRRWASSQEAANAICRFACAPHGRHEAQDAIGPRAK